MKVTACPATTVWVSGVTVTGNGVGAGVGVGVGVGIGVGVGVRDGVGDGVGVGDCARAVGQQAAKTKLTATNAKSIPVFNATLCVLKFPFAPLEVQEGTCQSLF